MRATSQLVSEHEVILNMLGVMEEMADRLEKGEPIEIKDIENAVEFVQEFADRCHHSKEEHLLFPAMEEAGIPKAGGPIGVMLDEHAMGRNIVRELNEATHRYRGGDPSATPEMVTHMRGYVELLSQHIAKENQMLFQMAEQVLPEARMESLVRQFEAIQERTVGERKYQAYRRFAEDMTNKYLYSKV
jgi:hemerythrin-like domain-containing protein